MNHVRMHVLNILKLLLLLVKPLPFISELLLLIDTNLMSSS